ncbi:MAG: hypothetical protein ILA25_09665 [Prevotella sp.]|nr:hypothetical protein [Prevotella sp.]MBP1542413.1 hypothetical protein [Prevotella sp.]MBP3212535.1 hypothetical protein [Prevotella sp.]
MNFVFISPHFPHTYWQFCQRLKQNGVRVLGIADTHYDLLQSELKEALTEYYRVGSLDYWGHDVAHDWAWWRKQIVYFMGHLLTDETVEYMI